MPTSHRELYYHLVWSTYERTPRLVDDLREQVHCFIREKALELGAQVHAVGGVSDHVHLVVQIPSTIAVSKFVADVKGASSHFVSQRTGEPGVFRWQRGYGAITFRKAELPRVVRYVQEQEQHHTQGPFE